MFNFHCLRWDLRANKMIEFSHVMGAFKFSLIFLLLASPPKLVFFLLRKSQKENAKRGCVIVSLPLNSNRKNQLQMAGPLKSF